ncbi:hypothetical protein [Actinacidiphila soli]|uniref:hypothetical protein n=1 Tax=Actinacidiphila soli TaxID=2487275 RepID=UPI0013E2E43E|nr:hypothetical protein [Actinacidiphila soli]
MADVVVGVGALFGEAVQGLVEDAAVGGVIGLVVLSGCDGLCVLAGRYGRIWRCAA